ncbi:hypothetical protein PGQ11_005688 [Apiospora arundinis]|uniref:Ankyrin repeat protein n=1 Tax=Apiospora arundinis TaxID=335852 RepID=A0ABR2JBU4_9PEZI
MPVIAGDFSRVAHVIKRYPNAIREENIIKQTPLHFAANKPQMLSVLLPAADIPTLNMKDITGLTPLEQIWKKCQVLCGKHSGNYVCGPSCHCLQGSDLILEAALKIPQCVLLSNMLALFSYAPDNHCKDKALNDYAKYIRECSDYLRVETTQVLMELGVKPSTMELTPLPGGYETMLLATIKDFDDGNPSLINRWKVFHSLYHWVDSEIKMAEALFQQGFTQVDAFVDGGLTPLAATRDCHYAQWLVDHGAYPNRRLYRLSESAGADTRIGVVSSHYAAFWLGYKKGHSSKLFEIFPSYFQCLLSTAITDQCYCACSDTGCTQFVYFLKGVWRFNRNWDCDRHGRCMAWIGTRISDHNHMAAIRFLTFGKLDLNHTCCDPMMFCINGKSWKAFKGDIDGIQEEERAMLRKLELLVEEFENEFRRVFSGGPIATPSALTSMAKDLGGYESDGDSASSGSWETISTEAESEDEVVCPYHHFWEHYWAERMREVLEEMNAVKMSAEEKRATEEIGVVWEDNTLVSSEVL